MPRLQVDAKVSEKKFQIADMFARGIIQDDVSNHKDIFKITNTNNVFEWNDIEVFRFYRDVVTDDQIKAYDDMLEKEKLEQEERKESKDSYETERPNKQNYHFVDKVAEIYSNSELTIEQKRDRTAELEENLKYMQLKYDKLHGVKLSDDAQALYDTLEEKFDVKKYENDVRLVTAYTKQLAKVEKDLKAFKEIPKKPGRLTNLRNFIHRIFYDEDLKAVSDYNTYKALRAKKANYEQRISLAKDTMKATHEKRKTFDYDKDSKQKEVDLMDYAKDIVRRTVKINANNKNLAKPELSEDEITSQANVVKETEQFKNVVKFYGNNINDVNLDTFFDKFMRTLDVDTNKQNQKDGVYNNLTNVNSVQNSNTNENPSVEAGRHI